MVRHALVVLIAQLTAVHANSAYVHAMVADRAVKYFTGIVEQKGVTAAQAQAFNEIMNDHAPFVRSGSTSPDFFTWCPIGCAINPFCKNRAWMSTPVDPGLNHPGEIQEANHWPKWQTAAVLYVRKKYGTDPTKWNKKAKQTVAYVFGVNTHYADDGMWSGVFDGVRERRGFEEISNMWDYGGDGIGAYGDARHPILAIEADLYTSYHLNGPETSTFGLFDFPSEDVANIFHLTPAQTAPPSEPLKLGPEQRNWTGVTKTDIAECSVIFTSLVSIIQGIGGLAGDIVFNPVVGGALEKLLETVAPDLVGQIDMRKRRTLQERIFAHPVGGIDDMAAIMALPHNRLARWFINGPPLPFASPKTVTTASTKSSHKASAQSWADARKKTHEMIQALDEALYELRNRSFTGRTDLRRGAKDGHKIGGGDARAALARTPDRRAAAGKDATASPVAHGARTADSRYPRTAPVSWSSATNESNNAPGTTMTTMTTTGGRRRTEESSDDVSGDIMLASFFGKKPCNEGGTYCQTWDTVCRVYNELRMCCRSNQQISGGQCVNPNTCERGGTECSNGNICRINGNLRICCNSHEQIIGGVCQDTRQCIYGGTQCSDNKICRINGDLRMCCQKNEQIIGGQCHDVEGCENGGTTCPGGKTCRIYHDLRMCCEGDAQIDGGKCVSPNACERGGTVCSDNKICRINGDLRMCCQKNEQINGGQCHDVEGCENGGTTCPGGKTCRIYHDLRMCCEGDEQIDGGRCVSHYNGGFRYSRITGTIPVSYYGTAIAVGDFDGDNKADTVVSAFGEGRKSIAPRSGAIYVHYRQSLTEAPDAEGMRIGPEGKGPVDSLSPQSALARFGETLVTLDFNLDGVDDLVVGAPSYSAWNLRDPCLDPKANCNNAFPNNDPPNTPLWRTMGRVYVYLGKKGLGLDVDHPIILKSTTQFMRLGATLSVGDVTGDGHADLLIGAEVQDWSGKVFAFASTSERTAGNEISVDDGSGGHGAPSFVITSPSKTSNFGNSIAIVNDMLVISAQYDRREKPADCTQPKCALVGKLYGFRLGQNMTMSTDKASFTIIGTVVQGKLGGAMAVDSKSSRLAVSMPDADGSTKTAGKVMVIEASTLSSLSGIHTSDQVPAVTTITGSAERGRFGSTLLWSDVTGDGTDDLFVSAPFANGNIATVSFSSRELGNAFVYSGAKLPAGEAKDSDAIWTHFGNEAVGRFGLAVAPVKIARGSPCLAITYPYAQTGMGGLDVHCIDPIATKRSVKKAATGSLVPGDFNMMQD